MSRHALLKTARLIHLYIGVFIAPAILFFAFTGAVQTLGFHETNRDHPNYIPARILVVLAQIHKKQTPIVPVRKPQPAPATAQPPSQSAAPSSAASAEPASAEKHEHRKSAQADAPDSPKPSSAQTPAGPPPAKHNPVPLRIFFLIVALGLFTSTFTGLYMSYKFVRNKPLITATLAAGIVIPILLTVF